MNRKQLQKGNHAHETCMWTKWLLEIAHECDFSEIYIKMRE